MFSCQTDVMHQSVFELIHTEDQQEFRSNLHWALNPPAGLGPPTDPSTGLSTEGNSIQQYLHAVCDVLLQEEGLTKLNFTQNFTFYL